MQKFQKKPGKSEIVQREINLNLKKCILETEKYAKIIIYSDKKLTGKRFSLH